MRKKKQQILLDYLEVTKRKKTSREDFYTRVYEIVAIIPKGSVTSYGAIAETLGLKSSARTVGYAMGIIPEGFPAHRVLNRNGELSGAHKFGGYKQMRSLLEREGVTFIKKHVDMRKHFWHPNKKS
ncbi:MAG TPA: MGMT family protein [Candidatus Kapabacteria bacterium]|nr:MGMT family protein [Candidatus Kapabacteria bacterium]